MIPDSRKNTKRKLAATSHPPHSPSLLFDEPPFMTNSLICLFTAFLFLLSSCTLAPKAQNIFKDTRIMMGTVVSISVVADDKPHADAAIKAAFDELDRLEKMMSVQIPTSVVSKINRNAGKGPVKVPSEIMEVLVQAREVYGLSSGLFDVTIGPLVHLWGIETKDKYVPGAKEIAAVLPLCGFDNLDIDNAAQTVSLKKPGMAIDLGGIAKGYAADRAIEVLQNKGISGGIIAVAGDIRTLGTKPGGKPWHIGGQHPRDKEKLLASLEFTGDLTNQAVSTAGDYERFFMKDGIRYHHILDPRTGFPASTCQSATVVAPKGLITDPLSTAIFLLGPEAGMALVEKMPGVAAIIVDKNGKVTVSKDLKNKVHIQ